MSNYNASDAHLSETIRSILLAFEAPPSVIDHFQLDDVREEPFAWVQKFYNFRRIEDDFGMKLKVLFALTAITTILSIATLVFQQRARSQAGVRWLFRRQYHSQSRSAYIVPHPVNIVVLASLVTGIVLIIYLGLVYNAYMLGKWGRLTRISSWFPSVWITYYAAVWFSGFGSLYLTYLVPSQYTRRGSLTGVKRHASPALVNALCFGVPLLCAATVLPLQVKQSSAMRLTMRSTKGLSTMLGPLSMVWFSSSDPENTVSLVEIQEAVKKALSAKRTWELYWTAELGLWSFWSLLALIVALPFCLSLVLSTHKRIRRMATAQSGLNQWTTGQFKKHSPPLSQAPDVSPANSTKDDITPSPTKSIGFSTPDTFMSVPPYSSPASSFPPSVVQTPNTYEHMTQPFFSFHSPGSFSSKSPSMVNQSPSAVNTPLPELGKGRYPKRGSSYGRHSIQVLRRMSHSAVFPSRTGGQDGRGKTHLDGLDKRYWHIAAEYTTVLLVMVLICAFAMFELASQSKLLTDCPKKVLSTIVVSFAYCCLVNVWLSYNLYRLYRDTQTFVPSRANSCASSSSASDGKRPSIGPAAIFEDYTLPEKRPSKSLVHFSDMIRNGSQYEPERRPSSSPPPTSVLPGDDSSRTDFQGLKIEIITDSSAPGCHRPSVTGSTLHQSFERRRSSYRAPSMDLTEALALAPVSFHRRSSVQR